MEATKRCPFCAEEVLADAIKCKHCQSDLKGNPLTRKREAGELPGVVIGLILLGAFAYFVWPGFGSTSTTESPAAAESPAAPDVSAPPPASPTPAGPRHVLRTTAIELKRRYDANEVATDQRIGKSVLEITGAVNAIDKDFLDNPVLDLATEDEYSPVRVQLSDTAKAVAGGLSKGDQVVIRCGTMKRVIGTPYGSDCVVVK